MWACRMQGPTRGAIPRGLAHARKPQRDQRGGRRQTETRGGRASVAVCSHWRRECAARRRCGELRDVGRRPRRHKDKRRRHRCRRCRRRRRRRPFRRRHLRRKREVVDALLESRHRVKAGCGLPLLRGGLLRHLVEAPLYRGNLLAQLLSLSRGGRLPCLGPRQSPRQLLRPHRWGEQRVALRGGRRRLPRPRRLRLRLRRLRRLRRRAHLRRRLRFGSPSLFRLPLSQHLHGGELGGELLDGVGCRGLGPRPGRRNLLLQPAPERARVGVCRCLRCCRLSRSAQLAPPRCCDLPLEGLDRRVVQPRRRDADEASGEAERGEPRREDLDDV
mmetsp:Transcript_22496/g.72469  ORF Transcript_22496/g.72469 Transcript_22496/m.72469 type:complete len:331 (+) Transcript_22496:124-1116(+)